MSTNPSHFKPGQSGNPGGRRLEKPFRNALLRALGHQNAPATGETEKLNRIAGELVQSALNGSLKAIREIADRLDGKPPQTTTLQGDEEGGALQVLTEIRRTIVDPTKAE